MSLTVTVILVPGNTGLFCVTVEEIWISKEEVMNRYGITDRQLEYLRDEKKVRYRVPKDRRTSFYIESDIQKQARWMTRPKKSTAVRIETIQKKLRTIDPPFGILLIALCCAFLFGIKSFPFWWGWLIVNYPTSFLLLIVLIWYLTRLIKYIYKRISPTRHH
jgi:hypothetical protein